MTLDELMDKMPEVGVTIRHRDKAKLWLFEYGCAVADGYGLCPKTHEGFVNYCGVHKLATIYREAMYAAQDPDWEGAELSFKLYEKGPKSIPALIKREFREGTLPTRKDYLKMIHRNLGPIEGLESE